MKICVISFDFWGYDQHIVDVLRRKGVHAYHIKIGAVTHANFTEKAVNAFSKVFLKKNLKKEKRQQYVLDSLAEMGHQDQILVLNPDTFDLSTLEKIKAYTDRMITYLYDNLERFPVEDKLHLFDKVFSFDDKDIKKHGFERLTNYNYLEYIPQEKQHPVMDLYYITSFDKGRNKILLPLAKILQEKDIAYGFVIVGKKAWKEQIKTGKNSLKNFTVLRRKPIPTATVAEMYKNTIALLDLMRSGQTGLSFRVFEAMAMEKKIVTDNREIKNYDFYNPNNILVLDKDLSNISKDFFLQPYEKVPDNIYHKYTLDNWTDKVFELHNN